nr:MAG TPA: hypothetical protein [Caudoviricetes sp.]
MIWVKSFIKTFNFCHILTSNIYSFSIIYYKK